MYKDSIFAKTNSNLMKSIRLFSVFPLVAGLLLNTSSCSGESKPTDAVTETAEVVQTEKNAIMYNNAPDSTLVEYLDTNKITGHQTSDDNITFITEVQGEGAKPKAGDYVKVHYTGTLLDGTKFDSSVDRGQPFVFQLGQGQVIPGWDKGIPLFNVGGKGKLFLPSTMAYGANGAGEMIPANAPLVFEIEVLEILDEAAYEQSQRDQISGLIANYINQNFKDQVAIDAPKLEAYAKEKGYEFEKTASGLMIVKQKAGEGKFPVPGKNQVSVHYTGTLLDGTKFDSSVDRGQPFTFPIGGQRVIIGWDEGLMHFQKGGKGILLIPSSLGYGTRGSGGSIPPNSPLVFEVEITGIN